MIKLKNNIKNRIPNTFFRMQRNRLQKLRAMEIKISIEGTKYPQGISFLNGYNPNINILLPPNSLP